VRRDHRYRYPQPISAMNPRWPTKHSDTGYRMTKRELCASWTTSLGILGYFFLSLGRLKHNIDNEYDRPQLAAGHAHCLMSPP